MVRILHLLDHAADFETARSSESLARAVGEGFDVVRRTIGYGGDYRDVATAAAMLRRSDLPFDLIHAWGGAALAVAALGATTPMVFSPSPESRGRTIRWLRAVMSYRRVEVISPTFTLRRTLVQRGIPIDRCHLSRPGVEFARIRKKRDLELRARLGLSETDYVFLAAGESTRAAAHIAATWAVSILHVADPKYKILIWGKGPGREGVVHFAEKTMPTVLRVADLPEYEDLLPAADMVLVTAKNAVATLPIAISMAANMPIVASVTPTVAELLEDRHTALMTTNKPKQIAQRILDLVDDTNQQWQLADMARTEAYEYFSFTRFVNQFRAIYRQVQLGQSVQVPEQGPGAGLRFHGRVS